MTTAVCARIDTNVPAEYKRALIGGTCYSDMDPEQPSYLCHGVITTFQLADRAVQKFAAQPENDAQASLKFAEWLEKRGYYLPKVTVLTAAMEKLDQAGTRPARRAADRLAAAALQTAKKGRNANEQSLMISTVAAAYLKRGDLKKSKKLLVSLRRLRCKYQIIFRRRGKEAVRTGRDFCDKRFEYRDLLSRIEGMEKQKKAPVKVPGGAPSSNGAKVSSLPVSRPGPSSL